MYNVLLIGSGPANIFAALELERLGISGLAIIDKTTYPSGGLRNDIKLNLDSRIGMDLAELKISSSTADEIISYVDSIFSSFPLCKQVTYPENKEIEEWKKTSESHGVNFIAPLQKHIGSDNAKALIKHLRSLLKQTEFVLEKEIEGIRAEKDCIHLDDLFGKVALVAPGRSGAYWFRSVAQRLGVKTEFGPIDVGIRIECNRQILDPITNVVYDPKFIFNTKKHKDKVRTFCTNPGGRVRVENYNHFKLVNGDALSSTHTENTNFALLSTVILTKPFSDTTEFGRMVAQQFHLLGGGKPLVQRVGDFREGRRSTPETFNSKSLHFDFCKASLPNTTPGDISFGFPARILDNLWESLKTLDKVVPGILHPSTLLYGPELKFYDTKYITNGLETNIPRLFVAGDGCGKSRGIVGAAVSGILAAREIKKRYFSI